MNTKPDDTPAPDDRLVKLATARDEFEAGMWKEALRREGIIALIRNVDPVGVAYGWMTINYGFDLYVTAADAARATEILDLG